MLSETEMSISATIDALLCPLLDNRSYHVVIDLLISPQYWTLATDFGGNSSVILEALHNFEITREEWHSVGLFQLIQ